ncbi:MAG: cytochrome c maturation protein CcmE [Alphaproteobacteria bacterium]|nr:cytochrome c maturation protein CcmE [Alphaproteobacteria bacterium]
MTPKRQRLIFAIFGIGLLTASTLLIMNAFNEHLVFFYTPSDLHTAPATPSSQLVRIGGLVEEDSVTQTDTTINFVITDLSATLPVTYVGTPPALFREGQGVVAEGYVESNRLRATKLLAKHDENYMPPEVAEALRKSGRWKQPVPGKAQSESPIQPATAAP